MVATRRRSEGVSESGRMSLNLVPSMNSSSAPWGSRGPGIPRDNDPRPGEVGGETAGVLRLCGVVELAPDHDLELGNEAADVHEEPAPEPAVQQRGEVPHELQIRPATLPGASGRCTLTATVSPPRSTALCTCPMLAEPSGYRVEGGEHLLDGSTQLPLDDPLRHPGGHGFAVSWSFCSSESTPSGSMSERVLRTWPNLTKVGPEVVEGAAQPHAEVGREELLQALLLPAVPPDVEDEAEAVPDEDAADLGEAPEVPRAAHPG